MARDYVWRHLPQRAWAPCPSLSLVRLQDAKDEVQDDSSDEWQLFPVYAANSSAQKDKPFCHFAQGALFI